MIRTQGGSVLYVCTKFQADSSFRSKVIMGSQNFKTGSRERKPRPFEPETLNLCRHSSSHTFCQILCSCIAE